MRLNSRTKPGIPILSVQRLSPAKFIEASKWYRNYFHEEVLGRFDDPVLPPNARTRLYTIVRNGLVTRSCWTCYPDLFAWGILCVPTRYSALASGVLWWFVSMAATVVPPDTVEGDDHYYHDFAAKLAEQGFVTFAPHNLYRGEDRYRFLSRKANGIKASLFSFIIAQHAQLLRWLATLDFVDAKRIAFYGLSYGGETAVRVPTVLQDYALSICSGDFNSWTEKVAGTDQRFSFMYSIEWEMPYFDMGSTFDYAEMTYLMLPRPFMVERGHNDRVGRDEWVAHEYAKVRGCTRSSGWQIGPPSSISMAATLSTLRGHLSFCTSNWRGLSDIAAAAALCRTVRTGSGLASNFA